LGKDPELSLNGRRKREEGKAAQHHLSSSVQIDGRREKKGKKKPQKKKGNPFPFPPFIPNKKKKRKLIPNASLLLGAG